ncbi:MAG: hypothetical protein H6840_12115 [Planctomycetes bacterium]|nr:hypothetical protein [Planctomycetota bacterium]
MTEAETKPAEPEAKAGEKAETTIPEVADQKVPLWIKLMWLGFIIWIIWYVIMGLQSTPESWA